MERIEITEYTDLHDVVVGLYNLLFDETLDWDDLKLYYIESDYVEAEIFLPSVGINRQDWEDDWSPERKLEVLLHEFAHVEEGEDEPDHGSAFYARLVDLAESAAEHHSEIDSLFESDLDFEEVRQHLIDSVNEHTIEADSDTIERRKAALNEAFASTGAL